MSTPKSVPEWLRAAREHWQWTGERRPPFAVTPGPGQVSVWDFPRPPRIVPDPREVVIRWGGVEVARTHRAVHVQETSHPPSVYVPWNDVARHLVVTASGSSMCEWKGPARYWTLVDGVRRLDHVGWSYPQPFGGAEALADCVSFYPRDLECLVGGGRVLPQPGGFYGGWITDELVGPFKGAPGSDGW